ncbi:Aldo/keto reductase [Pleurostoma richardsiae]|uniref:Aldo/keto reductase n=1 Tax=Pleurostoma richardsiae TaxID=41990 RepID=A0AA38VQ50_9PEZI|nr:Aldo/keto reductase [Pleurostoma richardsiae]
MSSNPFSLASTVKLATGQTIPQIQLGLYMMSGREAQQAIGWALAAGYRGFDCAQMYHNEREAGRAIRDFLASPDGGQAGLKREDVFYTTKLASCTTSYDAARRSIKKSVDAAGLGYVDLFLLHSPYGGREARLTSWRALEDAVEAGEVRMAGVSNYGVKHIEELMASKPRVHPVINQIEVHPFNTQTAIRETCAKHNIVVEAYAPLARGMRMKHPTIVSLSKKYGCSPAQLFVRWSLQHGMVTLPKSSKKQRLIDNANVGWFEISKEDLDTMDGLDEKLVTDWDPTDAP